MANDLVKRFVKKDGSQRISFYQDEYADSPRDMTDEPLHCCDWARNCSIMVKNDPSYSDARSLINQMLVWHGKRETIIAALCKGIENNRLEYNRSERRWELKEHIKFYGDKEYEWYDAEWFDGRKDEIDFALLIEKCLDSTINELCNEKYWTDGVKIASYSFGYYGEISFDDDFDCDSEGICWLEKDEFLKYSGCKEDYWKGKTLKEIEWLTDELEAWSEGEVYGYVVEDAVKYKTTRTCLSGNGEDEEYEETEWEEKGFNSCWGFYGEFDKRINDMFEQAGLNKEDFEEERL